MSTDTDSSSPYRGYVPPNPDPDPTPKTQLIQHQLEEVKVVMKDNIGKVIERGEALEDLQDKSDDLYTHAFTFNRQSRKLRCQMWWKNCRVYLLGFLIFAVILVLILWASGAFN
jgi:hypothetical protein